MSVRRRHPRVGGEVARQLSSSSRCQLLGWNDFRAICKICSLPKISVICVICGFPCLHVSRVSYYLFRASLSVKIHALAHSKFICIICEICSLLKISVICVICGLKKPLRKSAASAGERNLLKILIDLDWG